MNGRIDLSDGWHGNANGHRHDNGGDQMEEWDESCSDSASSCSCTCSTCSSSSNCELCDFEGFDFCTDRVGDDTRSSGIVWPSFDRKNDHFTSIHGHRANPRKSEPLDDESGISTYSSGSDKETFPCSSSTSFIDTKQEASGGRNKPQIHAKKRVTFSELPTENVCSTKKNLESRYYQKASFSINNNTNIELEYKRLEGILNHIDPFKLHSIMKRQLKKKKPKIILALGQLLPKERYSGETAHCVRCHMEYSPQFGKKDCYLDHPKNEITMTKLKGSTAYIKCSLCKKEYWVQKHDLSSVNLGHCYVGSHTSSRDEAARTQLGEAQSCEDRGCIEFYV